MEKNGGNIEDAAFSTFTGKWAEANGFTKIVVEDETRDIRKEYVVIKFLKE